MLPHQLSQAEADETLKVLSMVQHRRASMVSTRHVSEVTVFCHRHLLQHIILKHGRHGITDYKKKNVLYLVYIISQCTLNKLTKMCYKGLVILAFILLLFWRTDVLENIGHYHNIV